MSRTAVKLAAVLLLAVGAARAGETPQQTIARLKKEVEFLKDQKTVLIKVTETMRKELEETRKVVFNLHKRTAVLRAQNAGLVKERKDLKKKLDRTRHDLTGLHRDYSGFAAKSKFNQAIIAELLKKGIIDTAVIKAAQRRLLTPKTPDVRTKVVDVRATGHVALGAGKDSKVREGHIFIIERGGKYVGKVRVTTVWKNFCGATIIEKKAAIKAGDDARTQVDVKKPKKAPERKAEPKTAPEKKPPEAF